MSITLLEKVPRTGGTPFDLSDLASNPLVTAGLLDLSNIRYVRLVDVVGSGPLYDASGKEIPGIATDSLGNPILDNWVTYDSSGFDYLGLATHAVGLVNFAAVPEPGTLALGFSGALLAILSSIRRTKRRHAA